MTQGLQRKQPWWLAQNQNWAEQHVAASHLDALYRYGEFVAFALMWNALDLEAGRVARCPVCFETNRMAQAYDQAPDQECTGCFGTTFEGGYRAMVFRPVIITDQNEETTDARRGETVSDSVSIQTTADFYIRTGDFMLRRNGKRYQLQQMDTTDIRSGFSPEDLDENVGGSVATARLEAPGSQAHRVTPSRADLRVLLRQVSTDWHYAQGVGRQDIIRPGGYLVPADH